MKQIASIGAYLGLALTIVPSLLVFNDTIDIALHKKLMLIGTILWFVAAPFWFRTARKEDNV